MNKILLALLIVVIELGEVQASSASVIVNSEPELISADGENRPEALVNTIQPRIVANFSSTISKVFGTFKDSIEDARKESNVDIHISYQPQIVESNNTEDFKRSTELKGKRESDKEQNNDVAKSITEKSDEISSGFTKLNTYWTSLNKENSTNSMHEVKVNIVLVGRYGQKAMPALDDINKLLNTMNEQITKVKTLEQNIVGARTLADIRKLLIELKDIHPKPAEIQVRIDNLDKLATSIGNVANLKTTDIPGILGDQDLVSRLRTLINNSVDLDGALKSDLIKNLEAAAGSYRSAKESKENAITDANKQRAKAEKSASKSFEKVKEGVDEKLEDAIKQAKKTFESDIKDAKISQLQEIVDGLTKQTDTMEAISVTRAILEKKVNPITKRRDLAIKAAYEEASGVLEPAKLALSAAIETAKEAEASALTQASKIYDDSLIALSGTLATKTSGLLGASQGNYSGSRI